MVTALIVCMSGQSFAMEEPEAGSAADNGAAYADPAQAETQTEAQAETQTEAQAEAQTGAQAETRTAAPAKSRADTEPLGAAPKEEAQPEMREVKVYRSCVITSIDSREGRIMVNWKRRSSGEGYCIYRRELGEETWTRVKKVNVNTVIFRIRPPDEAAHDLGVATNRNLTAPGQRLVSAGRATLAERHNVVLHGFVDVYAAHVVALCVVDLQRSLADIDDRATSLIAHFRQFIWNNNRFGDIALREEHPRFALLVAFNKSLTNLQEDRR